MGPSLLRTIGAVIALLFITGSPAPRLSAATVLPEVMASGAPVPTTPGRAVLPVDGPVVRGFDPPATPYGSGHRGVDLAVPPGTPVHAALGGTVTFSGQVGGRGWVTVAHGGGLDTTYGWLDPREVRAGEHVRTGQRLGLLAADASHLDWGARLDGAYLDPRSLLGRWRARLVADDGT